MRADRETAAFWSATAAASALALALTLPFLQDRLMHRDEALAVMLARRPLGEMLETVQLVRGGAPLHFVLASVTAALGGGLTATRLISALSLAAAVVGIALLGRALAGGLVGIVCAFGLAASPVALYYGGFARMYALFLALTCLALWCLVRALETWNGRWFAGFAAFVVLAVYTHPYGVVVGLIAAAATLAAIRRRGRPGWRLPLLSGAGVLVATAPLLAGYLVLASRFEEVRSEGSTLARPPVGDDLYQAFAHFVGVPRASAGGALILLWLLLVAALAVCGLVTLWWRDPALGVLVSAWLVLPAITLAVVRVQGTDNHVRYVIHVLPALLVLVATGAVALGALLGVRAAATAAAVITAALVAVGLGRGADLADYRYRDAGTPAQVAHATGIAGFIRSRFASDDLFLGYDPAFAYAVLDPRGRPGLGDARATARAEGPLIARSLDRLRGPIDHGWYAVVVRRPAGLAAFASALGPGYEVDRRGRTAVVRTRAGRLESDAFLESGVRVFEAAGRELRDPNAPTTLAALRSALGAPSPKVTRARSAANRRDAASSVAPIGSPL